jgi:hypothetical protein
MTARSEIQAILDNHANGAMDHLDAMVHDQASAMATRINNGGLKDQLEFLNTEGLTDEGVLAILKEAISD